MRRKDKPIANRYYHVYNRGVNFQDIFFNKENWVFFLRRLREYFTPDKAIIIAYCLMPNHYHLLVYLLTDNFGTEVMQPLTVSYSKAINNQEKRVGPLFQGPYKAKSVGNDRYLLHLSRYIHLNPVEAGLVNKPEEWAFSSYQEYIGMRKGTLPHPEVIWEQLVGGDSRNPVFDKNRVSEAQRVYADYVCSGDDYRAGLTASLLFDE